MPVLTGGVMCVQLMRTYFPKVYDIKYLMKFCDNLHGGLNRLAEILEVERIGKPQSRKQLMSILGRELDWLMKIDDKTSFPPFFHRAEGFRILVIYR